MVCLFYYINLKYQNLIEKCKNKSFVLGCGDLDIFQAFWIPKLKFEESTVNLSVGLRSTDGRIDQAS